MLDLYKFLDERGRNPLSFQFLPCQESRCTVMVSSHIWWVDLIAYALHRLGCSVLVTPPLYHLYTEEAAWVAFDEGVAGFLDVMKRIKVDVLLGGNTTAMLVHPRSGELLHRMAGVPVVHFWWDEPRPGPMSERGLNALDHVRAMADERTLNVFWDDDVRQEMAAFLGVHNSIHVPLATTPELWPLSRTPLAQRPAPACFLGNCFAAQPGWSDAFDANLVEAARSIAQRKLDDLDRPMLRCLDEAYPDGPPKVLPVAGPQASVDEVERALMLWHLVGKHLVDELRYSRVRALARRLGEDLVLYGLNWDRLGLEARGDHTGLSGAAEHYGRSKVSLNLFGACVHAGMPMRLFDIACCGGLVFTQYNRELPQLLEPGRECLAFRSNDQMLDQLDRVLTHPQEHEAIVAAGRRRVCAEHTWEHRMVRVLDAIEQRFDLPWRARHERSGVPITA